MLPAARTIQEVKQMVLIGLLMVFWFQGTNVTVHATDADLKVRCVKDVK